MLWPRVVECGLEINNGKYVECVLTGGIGVAKCLGKGTPVLMFDGCVKPVEEIIVGDLVMGPDSRPRKVTGLARGREEMFEVRQLGGEPYVVNRSHILSLQHTTSKGRFGEVEGQIVNLRVEDYLALPPWRRALLKGWKPDVVEFSDREPYDLYLLGLWLGDGHSEGPRFTSMDPEIVAHLQAVAYRHFLMLSERFDPRGNQAKLYGIGQFEWRGRSNGNPVRRWLCALAVIGDKHIPHAYKTASIQSRRQLLAGILDTDGSLTPTGTFVISQKRKRLSDDIVFVARSLGLRVTTRMETVNGATYYRSFISGDTAQIPTRLPRKQAKPRTHVKNINRWGVSVKSLGEGDYYGFTLEGSDRLFLLGDFTVTHNTTLAIYSQAYQLYALSCLADPHGLFDLDPSSEITDRFPVDQPQPGDGRRLSALPRHGRGEPVFRQVFPVRHRPPGRDAVPEQCRGQADLGPGHRRDRPERHRRRHRRGQLHGRRRGLEDEARRRHVRPGGRELQRHRPPA